MLYIIIIGFIVIGFLVGMVPIMMTELGLMSIKNKLSKKETIFPFQLSKLTKILYDQYEKMNNSSDSHIIEIIWLIIIIAIVLFILILSVIGIAIIIILSSYFIVFVFTFRIPTTTETMKGLSNIKGYVQNEMKPLSNAMSYIQ